MTVHLTGHPHLHTLKGICLGRQVSLISELRLGSLKTFMNQHETELNKEPWILYLYCSQIASVRKSFSIKNLYFRDCRFWKNTRLFTEILRPEMYW